MTGTTSLTAKTRNVRGHSTRARILNSALRLIWRHGYAEVGVNRLIEEAGIQKGSFYHFFPSKLDLLLAMFDHLWTVQRRQIARIYAAAGTPSDKLRAHVQWIADTQSQAAKREGFVPGLLHMAAGLTLMEEYPELGARVRGIAEEHNAFIVDIMRQISPVGDAEAERTALILSYFISGAIFQARLLNQLEPVCQISPFADSLISSLEQHGRSDSGAGRAAHAVSSAGKPG